jgi:hypothetical protein
VETQEIVQHGQHAVGEEVAKADGGDVRPKLEFAGRLWGTLSYHPRVCLRGSRAH